MARLFRSHSWPDASQIQPVHSPCSRHRVFSILSFSVKLIKFLQSRLKIMAERKAALSQRLTNFIGLKASQKEDCSGLKRKHEWALGKSMKLGEMCNGFCLFNFLTHRLCLFFTLHIVFGSYLWLCSQECPWFMGHNLILSYIKARTGIIEQH